MQWVKKGLTEGKRKTGGRNNTGRITAFHRGGGNKIRLRKVDYNRSQLTADRNLGLELAYINKQSVAAGSASVYGVANSSVSLVQQGQSESSRLPVDGILNNSTSASIVSDRGCVKEIIKDPNHTGKLALIHWESRKRASHNALSSLEPEGYGAGVRNKVDASMLALKQAQVFDLGSLRQPYCAFNESFSYILAPEGLKVGDSIVGHFGSDVCGVDSFSDTPSSISSVNEVMYTAPVRVSYALGNAYPLASLMTGTRIFNVDGKYARAAGCSAEIIAESRNGLVSIKLQSGQVKALSDKCIATIGSVSNPEHKNKKYRKAGERRWLGRRPHVRGVAMNPVDHPHGGGEGKTSGGRPSVTPWGLPGKGKKTSSSSRRVKS
jgi:ribosomal protein L2